MQILFYIFIAFIVALILIYTFFKSQQTRIDSLLNGTCPACGESKKIFKDDKTETFFTKEVILKKVLKNHGCSGLSDIEFRCISCDLKEIHSTKLSGACSL